MSVEATVERIRIGTKTTLSVEIRFDDKPEPRTSGSPLSDLEPPSAKLDRRTRALSNSGPF